MSRLVPSVIVEFIDQALPDVVRVSGTQPITHDKVAQLRVLLRLLDDLDDALMPVGSLMHRFLIAQETIRNHVVGWEQHGFGYQGSLARTPGVSVERNPVWEIRQLLKDCSDTAAPATVAEMTFIDDPIYRARLREDVFTAESAFRNKEFKAATVIAGSVVEALLLLSIERYPSLDTTPLVRQISNREVREKGLEYAGLSDLVKIARSLRMFSEEALKSALLAGEFRNLIHPGKERRKQAVCNQATARSALAAMDHLILECDQRGSNAVGS